MICKMSSNPDYSVMVFNALFVFGGKSSLTVFFVPFPYIKEKHILKPTVWCSPEGCLLVGRV